MFPTVFLFFFISQSNRNPKLGILFICKINNFFYLWWAFWMRQQEDGKILCFFCDSAKRPSTTFWNKVHFSYILSQVTAYPASSQLKTCPKIHITLFTPTLISWVPHKNNKTLFSPIFLFDRCFFTSFLLTLFSPMFRYLDINLRHIFLWSRIVIEYLKKNVTHLYILRKYGNPIS